MTPMELRAATAAGGPPLTPVRGEQARRARPLRFFDSPRAVLARLLDGDPLGLRPRVGERLRQRRLLIDPEAVHLCTLARIAQRLARKRGRGPARNPTDRWLRERVDEAIDSLLDEAEPGAPGSLDRPARSARACAEFNRLPHPTRESFFQLVLEERSLDELARTSPHSVPDLARRARRALQIFLDHPPEEALR